MLIACFKTAYMRIKTEEEMAQGRCKASRVQPHCIPEYKIRGLVLLASIYNDK